MPSRTRTAINVLLTLQCLLAIAVLLTAGDTLPAEYTRALAVASIACSVVAGFAVDEMRDP